jgi:tetratricopeptide (TPR) repeat protein
VIEKTTVGQCKHQLYLQQNVVTYKNSNNTGTVRIMVDASWVMKFKNKKQQSIVIAFDYHLFSVTLLIPLFAIFTILAISVFNCYYQHTASAFRQTQRTSSNTSLTNTLIDNGNALYNQSNYIQAIQYFDKALAIEPNNDDALYDKGAALNQLGNYTQAIPYLDKALAIEPNYTGALEDKGAALNQLGNYTQAIPYLDKALAIEPNDKIALAHKGAALIGLSNYKQAIPYLDKALAIDPKDKFALYNKGAALIGLSNYTEVYDYTTRTIKALHFHTVN